MSYDIIRLLFINSLFIFGWHYCLLFDLKQESAAEGGTLRPINKEIAWWFRWHISTWILMNPAFVFLAKPLYGCVVCMASIYGSLFYLSYIFVQYSTFNIQHLLLWPVYIVALAGLNRLLKNLCQIQ